MKPLGWVGVLLVVCGGLVLALRGVGYTKDRQTMQVGPLAVSTEQKGFIPPYVGLGLLVVGAVLIFQGRGKAG